MSLAGVKKQFHTLLYVYIERAQSDDQKINSLIYTYLF